MSQFQCVVCVFDKVSSTINSVHVTPNDQCAVRTIVDLSRLNPEHDIIVHAQDFDLFHIGLIDMSTGEIRPERMKISSIEDIVKKSNPKFIYGVSEYEKELNDVYAQPENALVNPLD